MASSSRSQFFSADKDSLIEQFGAITGAKEERAIRMLEVCDWNLEMAINMHVDSQCPEETSAATTDGRNESSNEEVIRAPIPPSRAVLVEGSYSSNYGLRGSKRRTNFIFDGFRDFQAETRWQEMELENRAQAELRGETYKRQKTFEDLFRPPLDLIHRGSFESARDAGQSSDKWLMVNIQNTQEFACQVLNRDVWSNSAVRSILEEHFIFWQVYADSAEGERYMQFYSPVLFPYVAIIDPRTGEKLISWNNMDAMLFCDNVTTFLSEHKSVQTATKLNTTNTSEGMQPKEASLDHSIVDESEELQLKAALVASLRESSTVSSTPGNEDDDESDIETFESDSESQSCHLSGAKESDSQDSNSLSESKNTIEEDWQSYLGPKDDDITNLVLRLPNGKRESVTWPCTSKVKALILFSETLGYNREKYELITNFPKRNLSEVPNAKSLKEIGLYPREMIFIQLKNHSS